jgi:hypothetical protein
MRTNSVPSLVVAVLALALWGCERAGPAGGPAAEQRQAAAASPSATPQAQVEAAFVGKATPPYPEGFAEQGGDIETSDGSEIWVLYGRWTHAGGEQNVVFVQRTTGTEPADERGHPPAQIVSALAIPTPRAGETIFTEQCSHPDYPEPASRIYAIAGTTQQRPGFSDPPSAAWRLHRTSARLLPIDAGRVACGFDYME